MFDQANTLRQKTRGERGKTNTRLIAIASGKGGVGKTHITVNLGLALQRLNQRVLVLDADLGMANIDVLLGLTGRYNLSHVLQGKCSLGETLLKGPEGLDILPGTSGIEALVNISSTETKRLMDASAQLGAIYDLIFVDIGAGIHKSNINFISACDEVIVVLTPEPTAIMDAYSLIKILNNHHDSCRIGLLINQFNSYQEGIEVANRMKTVILEYLNITVEIIGLIPFDIHVRKAVKKQSALLELFPKSKAARAIMNLGRHMINIKTSHNPKGLGGFADRFLSLFK